jgi:trehalose 6-phosphate synthase/phosphatase
MAMPSNETLPAQRLIVVSNRLPLTLRRQDGRWTTEKSPGGLATALWPMLRKTDGLWIGWPGVPTTGDEGVEEQLQRWRGEERCAAVDLAPGVAGRFYEGYANQTLWPLFHQFPLDLHYEAAEWEAYVEANRAFRDAVLREIRPGDRVWVHDYHLLLLPQMLRDAAPDVTVGFFLHIPFPSSEVFRILPRREEILRGMLGADLVAFQTHNDLQHFRSSLARILGFDSRMDRVEVSGRFCRMEAMPIGLAPEEFAGLLETDRATQKACLAFRRRFAGRRVLLAVDRLDYTKGIPHRLRAFRRLLEKAPHLRRKVVLVQVAVPSREGIPLYEKLRRQVNGMVGEINGDFSTADWTPVVYIHRSIPRSDLVALYATADVGWVTPLRDGMNLVAKEYVACQRDGTGALLLSEFAGAAAEMGEAFVVNPYDEDRTAAGVEAILATPEEERRARMAALSARVLRNNVFSWAGRFLDALRLAATERGDREWPALLPAEQAARGFAASRPRLLLLDYDGTLVPFARTPREAVPPRALVEAVERLVAADATTVCIVSGRPRADLNRWFGGVRGLWLGAEHGALLRRPDGDWEPLRSGDQGEWKARVRPVLEHFADRTPGSFIEEKEYGLVWHYRMADPEFAPWLANELSSTLDKMLAETEERAVRGHKAVEVRPAWANKGRVLQFLEGQPHPAFGFRLAMGDDRTDEDLFEQMPADAVTVHVGPGPSRARFRLADPADVRRFLERIAQAADETRLAANGSGGSGGSGGDGAEAPRTRAALPAEP